jgi:hypothetical protein
MNELELPEHELEIFAWRALAKNKRIDRASVASEILPHGAHPDYWAAAKKLGDHVLDTMAMRGLVWKDDDGWWYETGRAGWTK